MMSFTQLYIHMVFRTKRSQLLLSDEALHLVMRLFKEIAGELGIHLHHAGGVSDHIHLLFDLPAALSVAEAAQKLKAYSSRQLNRELYMRKGFAWQTGYSAFSVSPSHKRTLMRYIKHQKDHHRKYTTSEEMERLKKLYGIVDA